jgi:hypothetical protein
MIADAAQLESRRLIRIDRDFQQQIHTHNAVVTLLAGRK